MNLQERLSECLPKKEAASLIRKLSKEEDRREILENLCDTGQLKRIVAHPAFSLARFEEVLQSLIPVHRFYQEMGGLPGYREKILYFLKKNSHPQSSCRYHAPSLIDISRETEGVKKTVQLGISALPLMGEMIPLGGAADRLHLVDPVTGAELPAAKLEFGGKTLLHHLISDIQAREFLYFRRFGVQITTPIAIMTSFEKENHFHVEKLLAENGWFGRPKEMYRIFTQPLVPVVDAEGNWVFSEDFKLVMKPGGHGAIWKLARDLGVFSWLEDLKKTKILVRQINNPLAGLDYGLLALIGRGVKNTQKFGFASCPRVVKSAEGVNVLIEREDKGKKTMVLTNIEYCDFARFGIDDLPMEPQGIYSRFSSNTNLLFADVAAIQAAVAECPFPGLLLNLKKGSFVNGKGEKQEAVFGRLESTMQNIADVFIEEKKETLIPEKTFITYNKRHKTISTTKKAYVEGGSLQETPEACFYDWLIAMRELLGEYCAFGLPLQRSLEETLQKGPEFVFSYHPCLGPLYSEICEKIQGGSLSKGAELQLEISDVFARGLSVAGSLRVKAERLLGTYDRQGHLKYQRKVGKCIFRNVSIVNRGVNWEKSSPFWKGAFHREEGVEIVLRGNSTLIMEDVELKGSHYFEVQDRETVRVTQINGIIRTERDSNP